MSVVATAPDGAAHAVPAEAHDGVGAFLERLRGALALPDPIGDYEVVAVAADGDERVVEAESACTLSEYGIVGADEFVEVRLLPEKVASAMLARQGITKHNAEYKLDKILAHTSGDLASECMPIVHQMLAMKWVDGATVLDRAADAGCPALIRGLVEEEVGDPWPVLFKAARLGRMEVAVLLLDLFPAAHTQRHLARLLYIAAGGGHATVVARVLAHYADAVPPAACGDALRGGLPAGSLDDAVYTAASNGRADALRELLQHACGDANCKRANGWRPIHPAALHGHDAAVRVLIEHGADVEGGGGGAPRPLYLAASGGRPAAVEVLLANGADASVRDTEDGITARAVAKAKNHLRALHALDAHTAREGLSCGIL